MFQVSRFKIQNRGFSLIEIMISLSIFTMVILLAVGMLAQMVKSQRTAIAIEEVVDNSRFAMDVISKAVRMSVIQTSIDGSTLIILHPIKGLLTYDLFSGQIRENGIALTSGKISIDRLWFDIDGVGAGSGFQPKVTILMKTRDINSQSEINLQTTISQKELNI